MNHQESRNADTSLYCMHCSCCSYILPSCCCGWATLYLSQEQGEKWRFTTLLSLSRDAHLCQLQLCPSGELGQIQKQLEHKEGAQFSFRYRCQERWREPDTGGSGWCCQQEHCMVKGAGGRQGAEQMGRGDRMSNRQRQQEQCNSKSTNSFCSIKNKSLFSLHYSFTPYTYCRLDHCGGQEGTITLVNSREKTKL